MRLLPFFGFETFFRKFFNVLKGSSLQFVLIFCNRTNVKNPKGSLLPIFRHYETVKILIFCFFFENFSKTPKVPLHFFLKFCNRMIVKKSQRAPLTVFGLVRNLKMNNFCLKIRFSEAQHAISEFFLKTGVFFYFLFI